MQNPSAAFDPLQMQPQSFGRGINLQNGVLSVNGTNARDDIRFLELSGNRVRVRASLNGRTTIEDFSKTVVDSIMVNAAGGNDVVLNMTDIASTLRGGGGNDLLDGGSSNDLIYGQSGADTARGNRGNDVIWMGSGSNERGVGGIGDDVLFGGAGNDILLGGGGSDLMLGGAGEDVLLGNAGDDVLAGGADNDILHGQGGFNALNGNGGDDFLRGFFLKDSLVGGGQSNDRLTTIFFIDNVGDEVDGDFSTNNLTLREALAFADKDDIVRFDPLLASGNATIALTNGQLEVNDSFRIVGRASSQLVIDGGGASRIFQVNEGANVLINRLSLINGNADNGGAIRADGRVDLRFSQISNSQASANGGAIFVSETGTANLVEATISGNTAEDQGGGIKNNGGNVNIMRSTLSNNTATSNAGGAISQDFTLGGTLSLINSTVSGNNATFQGGLSVQAGSFTINNSTIAYNASSATGSGGGGLLAYSAATGVVNNSIIVGNTASGSADDLTELVDASQWFNNLIGAVSSDEITNGFNGHIVNATAATTIAGLAFNGGSTMTHALIAGSAAINAGRNEKAVDQNGGPLVTDQTGRTRIVGGTVDIGSYEA